MRRQKHVQFNVVQSKLKDGMGDFVFSPCSSMCLNTDIQAHTALQGHQSLSLFLGFHSAPLDSICKEKAGNRSRHLLISVCFHNQRVKQTNREDGENFRKSVENRPGFCILPMHFSQVPDFATPLPSAYFEVNFSCFSLTVCLAQKCRDKALPQESEGSVRPRQNAMNICTSLSSMQSEVIWSFPKQMMFQCLVSAGEGLEVKRNRNQHCSSLPSSSLGHYRQSDPRLQDFSPAVYSGTGLDLRRALCLSTNGQFSSLGFSGYLNRTNCHLIGYSLLSSRT